MELETMVSFLLEVLPLLLLLEVLRCSHCIEWLKWSGLLIHPRNYHNALDFDPCHTALCSGVGEMALGLLHNSEL